MRYLQAVTAWLVLTAAGVLGTCGLLDSFSPLCTAFASVVIGGFFSPVVFLAGDRE